MLVHSQYLAAHLAASLPDILWIDRDKGQLENPEAFHSLQLPALLLDLGEVAWEGLSRGSQQGMLTLTVKLVFRLPVATYQGRPLDEYTEMSELTALVHQALTECLMVRERRSSRDYFTAEFYVMEQAYDMAISYTVPAKTIPKPAPDIQATLKLPLNP